jgi:hypothetical protein
LCCPSCCPRSRLGSRRSQGGRARRAAARAQRRSRRARSRSAKHGELLAALSSVVKHVHAAELRVVVAAVLADAPDAVLIAHHFPKLGARLVTALARLNVYNSVRRSNLEAGSTRGAGRSGESQGTPCGNLVRTTGNAGGARACIPNGRVKWFCHSKLPSCGRREKRAGFRTGQFYPSRRCIFDEFESLACSFEARAPTPTHV